MNNFINALYLFFIMLQGGLSKLLQFYNKRYKQLFIIPLILLIFSLIVLGSHYAKTGEFIAKGVSLQGGTTLSLADSLNVAELQTHLNEKFPAADITVRSLSRAAAQVGTTIEASDIDSKELLDAVEEFAGELNKDDYTIDTTGPSLGKAFFRQAIFAVIIAFVLMSLVVYFYFRAAVPSFYAIFSVMADALFAVAMFNLFNLKLTTAGVAAFLMLIGYSIDTDILLTTRVLKRKEGSIEERIASAIPTGLTMTIASLAAVIVAFYATESELLKQIMFVLGWGLVADIVYTWLFNASLLRMYVEKKEKQNGN